MEALVEGVKTPPVSAEWIAGRYSTLRGIYRMPDLDDRQIASVLDDWRHALSGIPGAFVAAAFKAWIAAERWQPTPADISRLAREALADARRRMRPVEVSQPVDLRDECFRRGADLTEDEKRRHEQRFGSLLPRLKMIPKEGA